MRSMTGYGEAEGRGRSAKIAVQLRTLNHRHLDIQLRIPRESLSIEEEIRRIVREKISRGRVELSITRSPSRGEGRRLELDEDLLSQYLEALRQAKKKFGLKGDVDLSLCSSRPELFRLKEQEVSGEDERGLILKTLNVALKNLELSRRREGRQLRSDVQSQLHHLRKLAAGLKKEAETIGARLKQSLLPGDQGDLPGAEREAIEAGGQAFKGDIHEEVVRLKSHVEELGRVFGEQGPMGKKIDFLLQELQRELNTISSKAPQLSVVQLVLAGKERVEKIREQAQNVE